jgi:biopolymer transport protein ExbD
MAKRKHRHQPFGDEDPVFQIAPMIDVLLQILVFFMAITTVEVMKTSKEVKLPLAKYGQEEKSKKDVSIINVQWKGDTLPPQMEIDNLPADDLNVIQRRVEEATRLNPEHRVIIRADRETQYQFIQQVMQSCAAGNCAKVAFAVINQEALPGSKVAATP